MAKVMKMTRDRQKENDESLRRQTEQMAVQEQAKQEETQDYVRGYAPVEKNEQGEEVIRKPEGQQSEEENPIQRTVIGKKEIREASEILQEYKKGKENLERRIVENEQWWKMRHWEMMRSKESEKHIEPVSAWLFNSIANKHADAMDNYPEPSVLPRALDDDETAKQLSSILPVIIEQNDYEQVYSDTWWYKLKQGTGVKGVFWNKAKQNGLGDIDIKKVDILNLFWQPGITDIQKSRNLFNVTLMDNEVLNAMYPELKDKIKSTPALDVAKYIYDDYVDTSKKSVVVDWYYKKLDETGKTILHYVKYVNDTVLYATENDDTVVETHQGINGEVVEKHMYEAGLYDHGRYPFVFDTLFVEEGTPCGFGYIDVMKDCQLYIDKLNQAILENAIITSKKRYFVRDDTEINVEDIEDLSKTYVRVNGNLGEESIREIESNPLPGICVDILNNKVDELKETSGNRDFSQGSTSSGVTAASAISALMEAGSKLTRDMLKSAYRAYVNECYLIIELIRQFYDEPRCFRIIGEDKKQQFMNFDNAGMKEQPLGDDFGIDMGARLPVFDITVTAAKKSTYSRMSQNELALQFYKLGFFNPQQTDQTLACLEMMDFDGKDKIIERVKENGTMLDKINMLQQQMVELASIIDSTQGSDMAQQLSEGFGMGAIGEVPQQAVTEESKTQAEQSADRVRESTAVDGGAEK